MGPAPSDQLFRALADPSRRQIVERLGRRPVSVSELARPFAMSLPAVMQHLAVLEQCGIVGTSKQGRVRMCRLQPAALAPVEDWLSARRADWERRFDGLAEHLGEEPIGEATNRDGALFRLRGSRNGPGRSEQPTDLRNLLGEEPRA